MNTTAAPNLFIIGAPKCGTTSLFHWLAEHPEVCGSSEKETYYLLDRDYPMYSAERPNFHRNGIEGYRLFFRHCRGERYWLEATPDNIYQRTALDVLSRLGEEARVIVILRKPSERLYSLYRFARNNMGMIDPDLTFPDFVAAIRDGSEMLADRPILQMGIRHSRYADYLEDWLPAIGRERIHVLLFEDLVRSPLAAMRRLADELKIDAGYFDGCDFVAHNRSTSIRSKRLHRLWNSMRESSSRNLSRLVPVAFKRVVRELYNAMNQNGEAMARGDAERRVIAELDADFDPCNRKLESLLGIDLSVWRQ